MSRRFRGKIFYPEPLSGDDLRKYIQSTCQVEGVSVLTGNPDLSARAQQVLNGFEAITKKMCLKPPPVLFFYIDANQPQAFTKTLPDGTRVVGLSYSLIDLLGKDNAAGNISIDRILGFAAHEAAHLRSGDSPRVSNLRTRRKWELRADRVAAATTCNPQALIDGLNVATQDEAARAHLSVATINVLQTRSNHPSTLVRAAQLTHMKEHPSKACKLPQLGTSMQPFAPKP
jgi:Zn-dependent protease with chaperone function